MQSGAIITKKAHAGQGQASKWEIPVSMSHDFGDLLPKSATFAIKNGSRIRLQ
jgi:hypothetical protein